ncbi:uncharacterized protein [Parasteatoda tepidariorum]|uniref:uncharacterized protein isoform X1 n=1 Tax=Parasteatoda tepidariorum TaxID=114398 RepID=UPI00077FC001|nr:uncharacterized protein LOC107436441 isoform X1 [Parasteatoda tepidariorum]
MPAKSDSNQRKLKPQKMPRDLRPKDTLGLGHGAEIVGKVSTYYGLDRCSIPNSNSWVADKILLSSIVPLWCGIPISPAQMEITPFSHGEKNPGIISERGAIESSTASGVISESHLTGSPKRSGCCPESDLKCW